jgi:hypothetical protein
MTHPKWITHRRIDKEYEQRIREKPCLICEKQSECHHLWHRRNDSYTSVPLCGEHHRTGRYAYHKIEHDEFEKHHNIDLTAEAFNLVTEYFWEKKNV